LLILVITSVRTLTVRQMKTVKNDSRYNPNVGRPSMLARVFRAWD